MALLSLPAQPSTAGPDVPEGARAGAAPSGPERDPRAYVSLLVDHERVVPGQTLRVGVLIELARGWHVYWRNSGESGLPTKVLWNVTSSTAGVAPGVGPLRWPAPSVFREDDGFITTYGYSDQVLLSADLRVPAALSAPGADARSAAEPAALRIEAEADFLVCKVQCIPGRVTVSREVALGGSSRTADRETQALFDRFEARVPVSAERAGVALEGLYSQSAIRPGDEFRAGIAITGCAKERAGDCGSFSPATSRAIDVFVPDALEGIELAVTGTRPHPFLDGGLIVTLEGRAGQDGLEPPLGLRGVLALTGPAGDTWVDVDLELPVAAAGTEIARRSEVAEWLTPVAQPAAATAPLADALAALGFAFLGGLILNLMPCVFPVLAIKVFSVAELAHAGRGRAVGQGIAYAAGVLVSMWALALVVVGLRAAGVAVGWGFQFQEPLFVVVVGSVLVVFALNLFGAFEITPDLTRVSQVGAGATGRSRSFFEGLLAVVLATPCSAPYLGAAVGFAFASSAAMIVALFSAIGIGLAAPYVAITSVPGLSRFMPRPGEWMVHLRSGLGFALLGTVVWLLSILGGTAGSQATSFALVFLLAVAFVTWLFGVIQASGRVAPARAVAVLGLLCLGASMPLLPIAPSAPTDGDPAKTTALDARAFDAAGVSAALREGRPVFVYFTADWCLTCKVNERLVLENGSVQAEIEALDFDVFVGDWTRRDETIRAELARFGRAAVPMYLVYSPSNPGSPELLPEILTPDLLIGALKRAAAGPARAADHTGGDAT